MESPNKEVPEESRLTKLQRIAIKRGITVLEFNSIFKACTIKSLEMLPPGVEEESKIHKRDILIFARIDESFQELFSPDECSSLDFLSWEFEQMKEDMDFLRLSVDAVHNLNKELSEKVEGTEKELTEVNAKLTAAQNCIENMEKKLDDVTAKLNISDNDATQAKKKTQERAKKHRNHINAALGKIRALEFELQLLKTADRSPKEQVKGDEPAS